MRFAVLAAVLVLAAPSLASAQQHEPSASEIALARTQFDEGVRHAQANEWDEALVSFQRSYELAPRATTLLNLGGAQAHTHNFVAATESYRRYLATAGERDLSRYRNQVESALQDAQSKVAHVSVQMPGLLDADTLTMDGEPLPRAALGMSVPVDPTDHALGVVRNGRTVASRTFHAEEGAQVEVLLRVPPPSPEDVAAAGNGEHGDGSIDADGGPHRVHHDDGGILASPWFWIVTGAVVVAAVVIVAVVATSGGAEPFSGNTMPGSLIIP